MSLKLPGSDLAKSDINRLFAASVAGALSTAVLYTIFGLILSKAHADRIASEMALLAANSITPVITPGDAHLTSFWHLLGSGSFFGMTLGLMIGIAASFAGVIIWTTASDSKFSKITFASLFLLTDAFAINSGFSRELPVVSVIFGLLSGFAFFIPWLLIAGRTRPKEIPKLSWLVFALILFAPLVLLKSQSYELIRDSMVELPFLSSINNFYYENTLLAADVIKPLNFRTQNAIAVSDSIKEIANIPHGTLVIKASDPCSIKGAVIAVSPDRLACMPAVITGSTESISVGSILKNPAGDLNKPLRNGVGLFLKVPIIIIPFVWLGWASYGLAVLFRKIRIAAILVMLVYIAIFIPAFYNSYLKISLYSNPSRIHEYATSSSEAKRYLTLIYMLDKKAAHTDGLYPDELKDLSGDKKASTRLNSMILAGELRDLQFIDIVRTSLKDPQLNVRTKAVWALARIAGKNALADLDGVLASDPSWYVRDYAYNSLSKIRPESNIIQK